MLLYSNNYYLFVPSLHLKMKRTITPSSDVGLDESGYFNLATTDGNLMFLSGQVPETEDGKLLNDAPIREQTDQCLQNIQSVLESEGLSMGHILKTTIYAVDMQNYDAVNEAYGEHFDEYPARTFVGVTGLWGGVSVEIEAIATVEKSER